MHVYLFQSLHSTFSLWSLNCVIVFQNPTNRIAYYWNLDMYLQPTHKLNININMIRTFIIIARKMLSPKKLSDTNYKPKLRNDAKTYPK